ncbi:MAG: ABC transporter permease [Acidimicrobiia bacterium]
MSAPASTLNNIRVVTWRNVLQLSRKPDVVVFSLVQPIMFVLLFRYVFGGSIGKSTQAIGLSYADFLIPGIMIQTILFSTTMTAVGFFEDLQKGIFDRFRSLPIARSAPLVGRIVADLCNLLLVSGVIVAIGYVIGFRYKAGVLPALGSIVLTMGIGIAFCFLSVMFAATLKNVEAVQTSGFMLIFPLTFLSNVFVPVQTLEYQWLRTIAQHNPVSRVTDAFRACAFGGETARPVMIAIAWILGLTVGFAALAVRQYRKL